jgi:predicted RNA binding protein YcfA (HicA-like mRNA interferase family)
MQSWANYVLMAKQGMLTFQEWRLINNIPQEQAPFKSQEEFIEWLLRQYTFYTLTLSLSHDVSSTLENQILKYIDPTFRTSAAYLNRFFVNLEMIYATLQSTIAQTPAKSRLDERLLRLESELFQFLHSNEVKGPIYSLMKMKSEHAGYHLPLMDESLRALYAALSHFTDRMMKKLERIKTECSEAVDSDSLLKKTLRFSRLLVLVNDLGVVLRDRPQSPNNTSTLPEAFFSFLESPSDRDSADELAPGESPARKSEEETPSPPHLPTFSDVPPPSVAPTDEQQREEAPPSIVSTSEQKREETPPFVETKTDLVQQLPPIADILPSPEPLRDSPPADARGVPPPRISSRSSSTRTSPLPRRSPSPNTLARGILTTKKRNKLEKILSQLGLTPIRTRGGHTTWADEDKKTQMTVPHHTEISIGVRQDLYRRVTNSSISNDSEES